MISGAGICTHGFLGQPNTYVLFIEVSSFQGVLIEGSTVCIYEM